jgi:hypothetical protein
MSDSQSQIPTSDPGLPAVKTGLVQRNGPALHPEDQRALANAVHALEHNNLATRFATALGHQLGSLNRLLPAGLSDAINQAAEKAVASALNAALSSLNSREPPRRYSRVTHRALVTATGAAGGFFGLASLPLELPVSTVLILRTIAEIARSEGEDLSDPDTAFACLQVFALGAHEEGDTFIDSGYYAVRGLLAKAVSEAGRYAVERGITEEAAPILLRFVSMTGARFGVVVSQKLAAQAIPVLGAAGGAAINYAFAAHFQSIASGHFTIRRLERIYGSTTVRAEYERLRPASRAAA